MSEISVTQAVRMIVRRHVDEMVKETGAKMDEAARARLTGTIERALEGTPVVRAKLTKEQRRRIVEEYKDEGVGLRYLARKYGVHASTIQRVVVKGK